MAIGHVPVRERIILPKRQGVPLSHVLKGDVFPVNTDAYLYFYDAHGDELAFWPLTVVDDTVTIDIDSAEWWPYRDTVRSFSVFVVYPSTPGKYWNWFEGSVLRTS